VAVAMRSSFEGQVWKFSSAGEVIRDRGGFEDAIGWYLELGALVTAKKKRWSESSEE
jgi:hypothetical protein